MMAQAEKVVVELSDEDIEQRVIDLSDRVLNGATEIRELIAEMRRRNESKQNGE